MRLDQVNGLSRQDFVNLFSGVIEGDEAAAGFVESHRPFRSLAGVEESFHRYLDNMTTAERVEVVRRYPELGTGGEHLSSESVEEHKASGLSCMGAASASRLRHYNHLYAEKFGFPFVICAKLNDVSTILEAVERRLDNSREREVELAVEQVRRIAALRIRTLLH